MSQIGISFTPSGGSPVYNIIIDNFGGTDMPRTYQENVNFEKSATGSSLLTGPAYRQKYMWAISTVVTTAIAQEIDSLFRDWDTDRATGLAVACGVADTTFGSQVNASVVFSVSPTYVRLSPKYTLVSFGLMEV